MDEELEAVEAEAKAQEASLAKDRQEMARLRKAD